METVVVWLYSKEVVAPEMIAANCLFFLKVKSGSIFDNFLITDDEEYAKEFGDETWGETKGPEKDMKDKVRMGSSELSLQK